MHRFLAICLFLVLLTGYSDNQTSVDGLCINDLTEHVDWIQSYLIISGGTCKFTIEDDVMQLNYNCL